MSARALTVNHVNANMVTVSGHGSRDLVTEVTGRPPVWSAACRGWVIRPSTAADVIALAESRHHVVTITEGDPSPSRGVPHEPRK